jgi:hypothetical protein
MFGMEIETQIPLDVKDVVDFEDYEPLMESKEFRVVFDSSRKLGPIIELVMNPIDEHANPEASAKTFKAIFDKMALLATGCAMAKPGTSLRSLLESADVADRKITGAGEKAKIGTAPGDVMQQGIKDLRTYSDSLVRVAPMEAAERTISNEVRWKLNGSVHYTAGFALSRIPDLVDDRLRFSSGKFPTAAARAVDARRWAMELTSHFPGKDADKDIMTGYLALLYMQLAAAEDWESLMEDAKTKDSQRELPLVKQYTQALCRVPLGVIFGELGPDGPAAPTSNQEWLTTNYEQIKKAMAASLIPEIRALKGWSSRSQMLLSYAISAESHSPETVFGKMTAVDHSEPVGPVGNQHGGYALELRHMQAGYGDLVAVEEKAREWFVYVRQLHDPKEYAQRVQWTVRREEDMKTPRAADTAGQGPRPIRGRTQSLPAKPQPQDPKLSPACLSGNTSLAPSHWRPPTGTPPSCAPTSPTSLPAPCCSACWHSRAWPSWSAAGWRKAPGGSGRSRPAGRLACVPAPVQARGRPRRCPGSAAPHAGHGRRRPRRFACRGARIDARSRDPRGAEEHGQRPRRRAPPAEAAGLADPAVKQAARAGADRAPPRRPPATARDLQRGKHRRRRHGASSPRSPSTPPSTKSSPTAGARAG